MTTIMTKDRYILLRSFLKPNKKITLSAILASILGGCTSALLMALIGKQFVNIGSFDGISIVWFLVLLTTSVLTNLLAAKLLITSVSQYTRNLRLQLCSKAFCIVQSGISLEIGSESLNEFNFALLLSLFARQVLNLTN